MTDPTKVHYVLIVDRSGSMATVKDDMQGGIRSFIDKQLEGVDGNKRTVSFYQFDTTHDRLHNFDLLEKARDYELIPRGGTALLDAVGQAIVEVGVKLKKIPEDERPGFVMVIIVTDGEENSSRTYTRDRVKQMIEHQQDKYGWNFTYLGANQDSFAEAGSIGIAAASTLSWVGTTRSVNHTYDVLSASVSAGTVPTYDYMGVATASTGIVYNDEQREHAMGETP
jgi:uncharacterized protein YegL